MQYINYKMSNTVYSGMCLSHLYCMPFTRAFRSFIIIRILTVFVLCQMLIMIDCVLLLIIIAAPVECTVE